MKNNNKNNIPLLKLTQDIVFKHFFTRNKEVLISLLKNFLPITKDITHIEILNPEKKDRQKDIPSLKIADSLKQLSAIKKSLNKLDFKESSLYPNKLNKKQIILDLRVKLSTGENIYVEMQSVSHKYFLQRILFYWARLYSQDLEKGESYKDIHPAYSLVFTNFSVLDKGIKDFMSSFSIRRDKKPYQLFNKHLKIVIVELSKLTKAYNELLDLKEKWCYLLRESSNLTQEECISLSREKEMNMALKHLNKLSRDEELYQEALSAEFNEVAYQLDRKGLMEEGMQKGIQKGMQKGMQEGRQEGLQKGMQEGRQEGRQEGLQEGLQKGMQEGRQEGRQEGLQEGLQKGMQKRDKEVILNMLKEGFELSSISKVTGLSEDEIIKLKK